MNQRDLRSPRSLLADEVVPSPNGSLRESVVVCQHLFGAAGGSSAGTFQNVGSHVQRAVLLERPHLLPTPFCDRQAEALLPSSCSGAGHQQPGFRQSVSLFQTCVIRSSTARWSRRSFSWAWPGASVASSVVDLGPSHRSLRPGIVASQRPGPRRRGPANDPRLERPQKRTGRPTPRCSGRLTQSQAIMAFSRSRFEERRWPANGRR
jgi:hypothetical protein